MATPSQSAATVVVGYFKTGHSAHRAINALIDAGFMPSELGAAFHVGAAGMTREPERRETEGAPQQEHLEIGGGLRDDLSDITNQRTMDISPLGHQDAGSIPVQPWALASGAGAPFEGAGRPQHKGMSLAHSDLPSELPSDLPHDSSVVSEQDLQEGGSWSGRLRHVFPAEERRREDRNVDENRKNNQEPTPVATKDSQKFGTGEGRLAINEGPLRRYSQPQFEQNFSRAGIAEPHARALSHQIGSGGAIVTVHSPSRAVEAEHIIEAHGGDARLTRDEQAASAPSDARERNVELYGTLGSDWDR